MMCQNALRSMFDLLHQAVVPGHADHCQSYVQDNGAIGGTKELSLCVCVCVNTCLRVS